MSDNEHVEEQLVTYDLTTDPEPTTKKRRYNQKQSLNTLLINLFNVLSLCCESPLTVKEWLMHQIKTGNLLLTNEIQILSPLFNVIQDYKESLDSGPADGELNWNSFQKYISNHSFSTTLFPYTLLQSLLTCISTCWNDMQKRQQDLALSTSIPQTVVTKHGTTSTSFMTVNGPQTNATTHCSQELGLNPETLQKRLLGVQSVVPSTSEISYTISITNDEVCSTSKFATPPKAEHWMELKIYPATALKATGKFGKWGREIVNIASYVTYEGSPRTTMDSYVQAIVMEAVNYMQKLKKDVESNPQNYPNNPITESVYRKRQNNT